jgi:predicted Ser/Thr protein kinase
MSDETSDIPEFKTGDELCAGRFVVERELGHGGVGWVYIARDRELERDVACKVAHESDALAWQECRLQFEKLIRIHSRDVVKALGFFVHEDGRRRPVITLESIEGEDFKDWAQAVSVHERYKAIARIASAVAQLHAVGLAHGDFAAGCKIRVTKNDRVVLIVPHSEATGGAPHASDRASLAGIIRQWLPEYARQQLAPILRRLEDSEGVLSLHAIASQLHSAAATIPLIDLSSPLLGAAADAYREEVAWKSRRYDFIREQRAMTLARFAAKLEPIASRFGLKFTFVDVVHQREEESRGSDRGCVVQRTIDMKAGARDLWRLYFEGVEDFYKPTPYMGHPNLIAQGTSWIQWHGQRGKQDLIEIRLEDDVPQIWIAPDPKDTEQRMITTRRATQASRPEPNWVLMDDHWILERLGQLIGRTLQSL